MDAEIKKKHLSTNVAIARNLLMHVQSHQATSIVTELHLVTLTLCISLTLATIANDLEIATYNRFIRGRHTVEKQKRGTRKELNAGAKPAGVCRITDGRLAS